MKKICTKCEKEKEEIEFGFRIKSKGIRRSDCILCYRELKKEHYKNNKEAYRQSVIDKRIKNREFIKNLLQSSKCLDCETEDWRVLEFDHVNGQKFRNISVMIGAMFSIKNLEKEINEI